MNDYSHPFLICQHLMRNYHDACLKQDYQKALEIAKAISDEAENLILVAETNVKLNEAI